MTITLKPELEQRVQQLAESGAYPSTEAVIEAAVQLAEAQAQKRAALKADIQVGLDDVAQGRVGPLDVDAFLADLHAERGPKASCS